MKSCTVFLSYFIASLAVGIAWQFEQFENGLEKTRWAQTPGQWLNLFDNQRCKKIYSCFTLKLGKVSNSDLTGNLQHFLYLQIRAGKTQLGSLSLVVAPKSLGKWEWPLLWSSVLVRRPSPDLASGFRGKRSPRAIRRRVNNQPSVG